MAQTTVTTSMAITGLEGVQQIGDYLIVDGKSKPKFEPVGLIDVKTDAANVIVKASDAQRRMLPTTKVGEHTYLIAAQGQVWVRVVCIDFAKNIYTDEETEFLIGPAPAPPGPVPPGPTPPGPTPPSPDVPTDAFDNLGQRVAQWTAGLPNNQQLGSIYLKYANMLRGPEGVNLTVTEAAAKLKAEISALPGYTSQYATFTQNLNADLTKRWSTAPFSKGMLGDYWAAVAAGLGAK